MRVLFFLLLATPCLATEYTVQLTGTIDQISGPLDATVSLGTAFSYTFSWDTTIWGAPFDPNPIWWPGDALDAEGQQEGLAGGPTVSFGDYVSMPDANTTNTLMKQEAFQSPFVDEISHLSLGGVCNQLPNWTSYTLSCTIALSAYTTGVYADTLQHPETDWDLVNLPDARFVWSMCNYSAPPAEEVLVAGEIDSTTVTMVPEPSAWYLLGSAGTLFCYSRRRLHTLFQPRAYLSMSAMKCDSL
jgi:hypothetical protein